METQFRAIIPAAAAPRRGGARAACAYRHLRESIASGRLAPRGVYRRAGIATELGVSRVPVKRRSNDLDLIFHQLFADAGAGRRLHALHAGVEPQADDVRHLI
jgi:hypothetical protein